MKTQKLNIMCLIAALAIFTLPADAAQIVDQPITLSVPAPCVGEVVDLGGSLHTVIRFKRNSRRATTRVHVNAQGITGTGEITGRTFQANGEINIPFQNLLLNGQGTTSFNTWFEVTSEPGPDGSVIRFCVQETAHFTHHANGTVTVKFDNFRVDCSCGGAGLWDY